MRAIARTALSGVLACAACAAPAGTQPIASPSAASTIATATTATRSAAPPSAPASSGGVKIDKPFQFQGSGALCRVVAGDAGGDFPAVNPVLRWAVGPQAAGRVGGSNTPYTGPATYTNAAISGNNPTTKQAYGGFGTVVVNADRTTGTFVLNDGSASGSWDCGSPLALASPELYPLLVARQA